MKSIILTSILCLTLQAIFSQEEIIIENKFESGVVINGYKRGIWNYFDYNGEVVLKIDYDIAKVMYIKPSEKSFYILENGLWELSEVDKPPIFVGSQNEIDAILSENIQYPEDALKSVRSGKTIVSMVIDKNGIPGQYEVVRDFGENAGAEVIRVLKMIPDLWIPATKGEQIVATKLYFSVIFEGYSNLKDKYNLPIDPEIRPGSATLNIAPSVQYYKSFRIKAGNGMEPPTKKM